MTGAAATPFRLGRCAEESPFPDTLIEAARVVLSIPFEVGFWPIELAELTDIFLIQGPNLVDRCVIGVSYL